MKRGIVVLFFILLIASLGSPYAFNPLASQPLVNQAYADSTQYLGSERGDTWIKEFYQDGNQILVKQTFGVNEFVNTPNGYKAYHITQTPTHINVDSKVTPLSFDKNNCTNEIFHKDGSGTFIGQEYWGIVTNSGSGYSLYDVLPLGCDYQTGNNADGKTITVTRDHPKAQFISELTLNDDGSFAKPLLTLHNNGIAVNNGTNGTSTIGGFENIKVSFANVWNDVSVSAITFADTTYSGAELTSLFPNGVPITFTKVQIDYFLAKHQLKAITFSTPEGDTFIYDTTLGYDDLVELQITRHGSLADMVWVYGKPVNISLGETITLDPTFGFINDSVYGVTTTSSANTNCNAGSTLNSISSINMEDSGTSGNCDFFSSQFDVTDLPDSTNLRTAQLHLTVDTASDVNCDINPMNAKPSTATASNLETDINDGTEYVDNNSWCTSTGAKVITLPSAFETDCEALLSSDWCAVGFGFDSITRDGTDHALSISNVQLVLQYGSPITPSIATNDGVTSGVNLTYDWTYGSNFDNSTQPAITSSSVYVGDTGYPYTPLANWNATQDTKVGGITTSTGFDGLFHFDTLYTSNELGSANFTDYSGDDNHGTVTNISTSPASGYTETFGDAWTLEAGSAVAVVSGEMKTTFGGNNADHRRSESLGMTLSDTTWYAEFDWRHTASGSGILAGSGYFSDTNTKPFGTVDLIGISFDNGDDVSVKYRDGTSGGNGGAIAVSEATQYYMTLSRTDATTIVLKVYSDDARTSLVGTSTDTIPATVTGLDIVQISTHDNGGTSSGNLWYFDNIEVWNNQLSKTSTGTTTIETSSINSGFSNEVQFTNSGLNITSSDYTVDGTTAFSLNALITNNGTDPIPIISFDASGTEFLCNVGLTFIGCSVGGTDLVNGTLSTSMNTGSANAITITADSSGNYKFYVNGTSEVTGTDATSRGVVSNDLYFIGYDSSLANSQTWRLDELSILSIEQSTQDTTDFANRLIPFTLQASVTAPTVTYSHTGLAVQTDKCFNVTIWNSVGEGDVSGTECGKTIDPTPSQPTGLIATASSDSVIGLDWDDSVIPTIDNITGYRIFSESPTGNGWTLEVNDTASSTSSYSDTGLTTKTQYNYMVAGINATGIGSNSTASADYTWGVPDPITGFTIINPTTTTLDPNYTAATSWGYAVTGYETLRDNVFLIYQGNVTTFTDSGLSLGVSYDYSIRALSSFGNSTWVNATGVTGTGPPTGLVVNDCYHTCTTQLNLEWVAPVPATGVNGYRIFSESPIGNGFTTLVSNTTTTALFYNNTGLIAGQFYNYKVAALSSVVSSNSSAYAYSPHKLPYSVTDLVITPNSLLQFLGSWTAPSLFGTLNGYQINYTTPAGDPVTIYTSTNPGVTATISGLNPTVEYSFRVAANTNHGINATFGNLVNSTASSEIAVGDLNFDAGTNPDAEPIWYENYVVDSTTNNVQVRYDSALTVDCTITEKVANNVNTYTGLSETAATGYVYHNFTVTNSGNDVLDWDCYDQTDNTIDGQYSLTQSEGSSGVGGLGNVPMFSLMGNFTGGLYGTEGEFAGIDLITLFIVVISMLGFNKKNPALGVGVMATLLGAAWYYELIPWTSGVLGALAVVLVLAIGQGIKRD